MKKVLIMTAAVAFTALTSMAQTTINLPYSMSVGKTNGKWESWPKNWEDAAKQGSFVPNLTIKKVDSDIFSIDIYFGGSSSGIIQSNVVYDPTETAKIRKSHSNDKLTAYRYTGSKDYIWTENITLADIQKSGSKWTSTPNAKLYTWEHSLGSATVYKAKASAPAVVGKKYPTTFTASKKKVKGTWADWSSWSTAPKNSYFELAVITEGRVYNFKYYESGKLVKNYEITYDDTKTQNLKAQNSKIACYKIKGTKDNWVYLLNTTMRNVFANPDKWSNEKDAVIVILDDEKTGQYTRIK